MWDGRAKRTSGLGWFIRRVYRAAFRLVAYKKNSVPPG